ncbi:hypothetical protein EAF04_010722 [Stromatinia cepivora]|nr:hypothetical protein EAF04_010722 [Stromatinia cepivora]
MSATTLCLEADQHLGPFVPSSCRNDFDFTLYFEQTFFSIVPAVLFMILGAGRLARLSRASVATIPSPIHTIKLTSYTVLGALQLALLAFWCFPASQRNDGSIPSAALSTATTLILAVLSHYEQLRSIRPSSLLNLYLFISILFDATQARTLWLRGTGGGWIRVVFTVSLAVKLLLIALEAREKEPIPKIKGCRLSPETTASVFNRSVFWWLNQLFWSGYRNPLALSDLYPLEPDMSSIKLGEGLAKVWAQTQQSRKYCLLIAVASALRWPLLIPIPARLALIGFKYCQPFLLSAAVNYIEQPEDLRSRDVGFGLIGATAIIYVGIALSTGIYNFKVYRATTMIRGSLVSMIYRKTLQIRLSDASTSAALTLASSDVDRIGLSLESAHEIWASSIESVIAIVLLQKELGWACIAPVLLAFSATAGNSWIARYVPKRQREWGAAIQKRVAITSSVLRNMKSVKMMGLSDKVGRIIQTSRVYELDLSKRYRSFFAYMTILASIPVQLSAPLTFLIYIVGVQWYSSDDIVARAFYSLSLIQLLTTPLQKVLSSLPTFAASLGSFQRIQAYLVLGDRIDERILEMSPAPSVSYSRTNIRQDDIAMDDINSIGSVSQADSRDFAISCRNGNIAFSPASKLILHDIDITCAKGTLTMVIGPIGSGKTVLMNAILGEMVIVEGSLTSSFSQIAYCPQTPWVINATIKENILDHTPFDEKWYNTVLWSCALDDDIKYMPAADNTAVGSRGITLSGGQKQRLSLARAVYARKRLVILDDVLSALDARTEKLVFERLLSQHGLFRSHRTTVILVTHSLQQTRAADQIVRLGQDGHVVQHGTFEDLNLQDGCVQDLNIQLVEQRESDKEKKIGATIEVVSAKPVVKPILVASAAISDSDERKMRARSETATFTYYFKSIGANRAAWFLLMTVTSVFCTNFPQIWVLWWTDSKIQSNATFLGVYFGFAVGSVLANAAAIWSMMIVIVPISAARLHWQLLDAVLHAPLSFFSSTDSGTTLNRFSQDMSLINSRLPVSTMQATTMAFQALAQIALMATGSTYFAAFIPICLMATWMVQKFYLRTSRQLRLLDLELKSPLFSSISETLEGMSTIRAFGRQAQYEARNQQRLDNSQQPIYLLYCIQRWLNFVLDLIVAALAVLLITLATQLPMTTSGAALGVAMLNVLGFSQSLAQFIYFYTDLETSLQAVARVKDYVETIEPEDPSSLTLTSPPRDWPAQGSIDIRGITASYTKESDPVIKDVSILVQPGQKIGICGRTASGKSSLLSALFRLMELRQGQIYVDGFDLSTIPRQAVRSSLIAIPQEPFLLPGTVRFNVSPVESVADEQIISTLERVGLWALVQQHQGALDGDMAALALSHGQQQLLCLARAMLRPGTILVLDEATSNVDQATDEKMQQIIREDFRDRTVLTVAHRLSTILDSDQVIVMGEGIVVESGPPTELLAKRETFWELYRSQTTNFV